MSDIEYSVMTSDVRVLTVHTNISFLPFFFFDVLSTSNNSISLSSSSLNDKMGFFFAPLAFCERGAGVLASTPSISSSSLLSVFRRLLALVAAFLAINEKKSKLIRFWYYHIDQKLRLRRACQGSHRNSKTQFHDFFTINNVISMTI